MGKRQPQDLNKYNKIFEKLCNDGNQLDIYDMVAYGLYKRNKRNFIISYKEKNKKNPSQREIENHTMTAETQIASLKQESGILVDELFNEIMVKKLPEIESQILKKHIKPSFWFNVWTNIVASFFWALLLLIMYFMVSEYSIRDIGEKYFGKEKQNKIDSTQRR